MFRTVGRQVSLFELLLPPGIRVLSGELAEIDVLLDDERFFQPFRGFLDPCEGRQSIPMETYLRLLFRKYRFKLRYEQLGVQCPFGACPQKRDGGDWGGSDGTLTAP